MTAPSWRYVKENVEVYASECCGAVFVPGHGPDDIHEAERGASLVIESEEINVSRLREFFNPMAGYADRRVVVHEITEGEAMMFDAMRAGDCPVCGAETPGMNRVDGDGGER